MPPSRATPFIEPSDSRLIAVRVLGHILLALLIVTVAELGDSRFFLAGFILVVAAPTGAWLGLRFRDPSQCWIDPLCDLTLIIIVAWSIPSVWTAALCLALMVALSPSVSLHPRSNLIYACYGVLLLVGMGLAYWVRVPSATTRLSDAWIIAGIAAVYPTLIVYANWQRRRATTLLEQSHLLTAVTDLSGSVAHDFNNVLMAISGHAELAHLELPADHPAQKSLEEVVNGTKRASLLCGQLLAFTGKGKHQRTTLDVTSEVHTIVGLLRPAMPAGVSIRVAPFTGQVFIYGERAEFQQVLLNIIVNAGESMALSGGSIEINISQTNFRLVREVVITVLDEGVGIPEDALRKIFDPFYTTKDRGHGLGLASVKRIMLSHAGEIEVDSEPGKGTRVILTWPETRREYPETGTATPPVEEPEAEDKQTVS